MLLGQIISNTGRYAHIGIEEIDEFAQNIYSGVLEFKDRYTPELKKCVVPRNAADNTLLILSAFGLFGYALAPSKGMLENLGFLALLYAGLTKIRYNEAHDEEKEKTKHLNRLQNKKQSRV